MDRLSAYGNQSGEQLAVGLGWFSIALGIAEIAAPRSVARLVGVTPDDTTVSVLRSYGVRQLGNGFAILGQPDRATWMWSRVAGDVLDVATLASAMSADNTHRGRTLLAAAAVLGVTALDVLRAQQLSQRESGNWMSDRRAAHVAGSSSRSQAIRVAEAVTINAPMDRVREQWSNLGAMPNSLRDLGNLHARSEGMVNVEFREAPAGRGTEVHVSLEYQPLGGALGGMVAKMISQDPASQIRHDLKRFKQLLETGEPTLSDGPALWRPAQPAVDPQEIRKAAGVEV